MTCEAVDMILEKAWENHSRAFIYLGSVETQFAIDSQNHEWKVYDRLNLLCIHILNQNIEYYIAIDKIVYIHIM